MTDAQIAEDLAAATALEQRARTFFEGTADVPDRDSAQNVLRHATALRKSLEGWIGRRAVRAQRALASTQSAG